VTSLDGAAVDAIASHLLKQLFEEPRAASAAQSIETHGQVRVRAASTFDPTTLMPRRVTTETLMQLEVGGEAIEKADRQEWRFTWL
jgi:hypothetical protein